MALKILAVAPLLLLPCRARQLKATGSQLDVDKICRDDVRLSLSPDRLHYSNLKGYGPHSSQPHGMLISEVFPSNDLLRDLLITTVQAYYPANVSLNTVNGDVASISMDAGSKVDLQMTFLERVSRLPADPGPYSFTFLNFEQLTVVGCNGYELSDNTMVEAMERGKNVFTFTSSAGQVSPIHSFELSDDELAGAVMLRCNQPSISIEAKLRQGLLGDRLYITGPSNVVCPTRTTCRDYECPEFYEPFFEKDDIYCAADECSAEDLRTCCYEHVPTLCEAKHVLMFPPNSVMYSNLGSRGPDFHKPEGVRYMNVFPDSNETIDMLVNAVSDYDAGNTTIHRMHAQTCDPGHNGMHGKYGQITVSSGKDVTVRVSFRVHRTNEQVGIASGFFFTVYDFDNEVGNGGVETVTVSGYDFFTVSNTTTIHIAEEKGGARRRGTFQSTVYGTEADNPKNPRKLSPTELDKSVTFGFAPNCDGFDMKLEVSPGFSARNFEFTGYSVLPCPQQGQCSSMQCPKGYDYRPDPDTILCEGAKCTGKDVATCCQKHVYQSTRASCDSMVCPEDFDLKVGAVNLKCEGELCLDRDRDTCCKPSQSFSPMCTKENNFILTEISNMWIEKGILTVKYDDVFPYLNHTINLKVTLTGVPLDMDLADVTSIKGSLSRVIMQNDSHVSADFHFVEPDTGLDVTSMPDFFFTFLGGSRSTGASPRRMTITSLGLKQLTVSEDSLLDVENNQSFILGSLGPAEATKLETMSLFALDEKARRSAATMLLNTSYFRIVVDPVVPNSNFLLDRTGGHAGKERRLTGSAGSNDGALFFGGASSLTCKPRATCENYMCPSGFTLREKADSMVCKGEACTADDYATCCDCDPVAAFLMDPSRVAKSALGSLNDPDKTMIISNVFPQWPGHKVNLRIRPVGEYFPGNQSQNALRGEFLNINMRTSSEATFRFEFVDDNDKLARLPFNFVFSVFDLDQQEDGGAQEYCQVTNADWYVTSNATLVGSDLENDVMVFHSTSSGREWDNPENARALADYHLASSVSFMMKKNLAKFNVTIRVTDGFRARNVLFAGQSNLLCSKREVCSNFACPRGKVRVKDALMKECHGGVCSSKDEDLCCRTAEVQDVPAAASQAGGGGGQTVVSEDADDGASFRQRTLERQDHRRRGQ